ncbi:MAG: NYN domain-containing protein [Candidatus Dojkabacteria bacterium]
MENKTDTVYAFIDSQNINLGVSSLKWKLDWGKFRLFLRNKYSVKKAFLFIGFVESNSMLYRHLQEVGFILIFKNVLAIVKDDVTTYKGNVDAELVLHAMVESPNYDKAIVATGDGDFFCLIEYLEEKGKLEKVVTPNRRYSSLLKKYSKYIVDLYTLRNKLRYIDKKDRKPKEKTV